MYELSAILLIAAMLMYYKLIYYRYHTKAITPLTLIILGLAMMFIGIYFLFTGYFKESFLINAIFPIYGVLDLFLAAAFMLDYKGKRLNRGKLNNHIDITLTLFKKVGIWKFMPLLIIAAFVMMFFVVCGTYVVLRDNFVYLWTIIFMAWTASNVRLVKYTNSLKKK